MVGVLPGGRVRFVRVDQLHILKSVTAVTFHYPSLTGCCCVLLNRFDSSFLPGGLVA